MSRNEKSTLESRSQCWKKCSAWCCGKKIQLNWYNLEESLALSLGRKKHEAKNQYENSKSALHQILRMYIHLGNQPSDDPKSAQSRERELRNTKLSCVSFVESKDCILGLRWIDRLWDRKVTQIRHWKNFVKLQLPEWIVLSSNAKPLHNGIRWIVAVAAFHRPDHKRKNCREIFGSALFSWHQVTSLQFNWPGFATPPIKYLTTMHWGWQLTW